MRPQQLAEGGPSKPRVIQKVSSTSIVFSPFHLPPKLLRAGGWFSKHGLSSFSLVAFYWDKKRAASWQQGSQVRSAESIQVHPFRESGSGVCMSQSEKKITFGGQKNGSVLEVLAVFTEDLGSMPIIHLVGDPQSSLTSGPGDLMTSSDL